MQLTGIDAWFNLGTLAIIVDIATHGYDEKLIKIGFDVNYCENLSFEHFYQLFCVL